MIVRDFKCSFCCCVFEAIVDRQEKQHKCILCDEMADFIMSAPYIGTMNDPNVRKKALMQRSLDHSRKEAKANPEQIAQKLGARPKSQSTWNIRKKS